MTLYAESSAVLAWLMGEPGYESIRQALSEATQVTASDLTVIECDRALIRMVAMGTAPVAKTEAVRAILDDVWSRWLVVPIESDVVERSRREFPEEPLRALDAIHLATALIARRMVPELAMLSLDERIRRNARRLGLPVLPR